MKPLKSASLVLDSSSAADAAAGVLLSLPFPRHEHLNVEVNSEAGAKKGKVQNDEAMRDVPIQTPNAGNATMTTIMPNLSKRGSIQQKKLSSATSKGVSKELGTKALVCDTEFSSIVPPSVAAFIACGGKRTVMRKVPKDPEVKRSNRLEQNRRAARESRQRKKCMVEELQRSVLFFNRANSTLQRQNDTLFRLLLEAQECVANRGRSTGKNSREGEREVKLPASVGAKSKPTTTTKSLSNQDTVTTEVHASAVPLSKSKLDRPGGNKRKTIGTDSKKTIPRPTNSASMRNTKNQKLQHDKQTTTAQSFSGQQQVSLKTNVEDMPGPTVASASRSASADSTSSLSHAPTPGSSRTTATDPLTAMQPGSSMQAMAAFQQASQVAMQEALRRLQSSSTSAATTTGESLAPFNPLGGGAPTVTAAFLSPTTAQTMNNNSSAAASAYAAYAASAAAAAANSAHHHQQVYTDAANMAMAMQQASAAAAAVASSADQHQAFLMSSFPFLMAMAMQQQRQNFMQ